MAAKSNLGTYLGIGGKVVGSIIGGIYGGPMGSMIGGQAGADTGENLGDLIKKKKAPLQAFGDMAVPPMMRNSVGGSTPFTAEEINRGYRKVK